MVVVTVGGVSYYLNPKNKERWDKIRGGALKKKDEDRCYVVDGRERVGKSVFALQQAAYIDPSIINDLSRITFGVQETLDAIRKTESTKTQTKAIVFDEAFRGLSSKSALSKENKRLTQAMMEMGQKNLVMFIVSPSFFLLEFYSAVLRSNALFHILKRKSSNQRYFRAFNYKKKAILYQRGVRKGWGYNMSTKLKDSFSNKYPGGKEFEMKYRAKKSRSIRGMDIDAKPTFTKEQYAEVIKECIKRNMEIEKPLKQIQLSNIFGLHPDTIRRYTRDIPLNSSKIES